MQGVTSGPDQGICVTGSSRQTRRAALAVGVPTGLRWLAGCLTASRWLAGYATARPQWLAGYAPTRPHG
jgi:hypothetical protein